MVLQQLLLPECVQQQLAQTPAARLGNLPLSAGLLASSQTYGRISRYGIIAFASSLDQAGPITKTAEDAAIMLEAMAGHDPRDSTSINQEATSYTKSLTDSIKGKRIGVCREYFADGLDPQIESAMQDAIKELEKLAPRLVR